MGPIHREYIRKILYIPHNDSVIVSSGDYRRSLIITNINQVKHPYIFRLYKVSEEPSVRTSTPAYVSLSQGCECFDYSKSLNILITGSADNLARIWNPYVTQKNVAVLEGHHTAVIDIKIHSRLCQCYTFSKDAVSDRWPRYFHHSFDSDRQSLAFERVRLPADDLHSISHGRGRENAQFRILSRGSLHQSFETER